ncbi:MAG: SpoIID/LytB domain-containing protein [Clostridia bacterium]|nr:SpoIID/LytB domain-containing protein [Clostridia bacterium]
MKQWALPAAVLYLLCLLAAVPGMGAGRPADETPPDSSGAPDTSAQDGPETPAPVKDAFRVLDTKTGTVYTFSGRDFVLFTAAAELYPTFGAEAIKAQALATYSYYSVLRRQNRADPPPELAGADFANVPSTFPGSYSLEGLRQRWGDRYEEYLQKFETAVDAVYGQQILYNGSTAHTVYHAISPGRTEAAETLWGYPYPYLTAVDSPGDALAGGYLSQMTFSAAELKKALEAAGNGTVLTGPADRWLEGQPERSPSGTVLRIRIGGTDWTGMQVRKALRLRSACFEVTRDGEQFTFAVKGYGHGVGLSQCGAAYMAAQGADCAAILQHYYPGTAIGPVPELKQAQAAARPSAPVGEKTKPSAWYLRLPLTALFRPAP